MSETVIYLRDTFFSVGETEVLAENQEIIGILDLPSMLTADVSYKGENSEDIYSGHFPFLSSKWIVEKNDTEIGRLVREFTFFSKKYVYYRSDNKSFHIKGEAFSKEYLIYNGENDLTAQFDKVSGWFESAAYRLTNFSNELSNEELILAIMGVNAIEKKRRRRHSAPPAT